MASDTNSGRRLRLDELLVQRGLFRSRSRARDAVERGTVRIGGALASKPGQLVVQTSTLEVDDPAGAFGFDIAGATALDIGASTGGFTQVLLERGAARAFAVDVGHDQFDQALRADPRIVIREGLNARHLTAADLDNATPDFLVADVSFISLKLALPPALKLVAPGARGVFLVKPQFEAGRSAIGKGGILKDPAEGPLIAQAIAQWLDTQPGWRAIGVHASPIEGGDGNREYLLGAVKDRQ